MTGAGENDGRSRHPQGQQDGSEQLTAALNELRLRNRNALARVRSILRRMAGTYDKAEDFAMHLEGRLDAIARSQGQLVDGADLAMVLATELMVYHAREGQQFTLAGPTVRLRQSTAQSLGLAFHELATNAIKFGALSEPTGLVCVAWQVARRADTPELTLRWTETGGPKLPGASERRGFGREVLEQSLPYEIGATVEVTFEADGLRCTIVAPLA